MNGTCHICHKTGKLTFEHIPPYSVGNKKSFARQLDETGEVKRRGRMKRKRKGYGRSAVCEACRKITEPYTTEYIKAHKAIVSQIDNIGDRIRISVVINPLYFVKYIAHSILCLNDIEFGKKHTYLRKFVLEPSSKTIQGPVQFLMYITDLEFYYNVSGLIQTWPIPTLDTDWSNEDIKALEEGNHGLLPEIRETTNKTPSRRELLEWERLRYNFFLEERLTTSQWCYAPVGFIFSTLFPEGMTNCYTDEFCDITEFAYADNTESEVILQLPFKPFGICPFFDPSRVIERGQKVINRLHSFNNPLSNTDFAGIAFYPFNEENNILILMSPTRSIQLQMDNVDLKSIEITYTDFSCEGYLNNF